MKNRTKIVLSCWLIFFSTLSLAGIARSDNNIAFLNRDLIKKLNFGIYEVVTPKLESGSIEYGRELPFDKLDFIERNEKYFSIGTAFFINDKELMTAAHVFSLMYFSLLQDFYIRDPEGNVYPVGQIKKHSTHRDMAVFDLKQYPGTIEPLGLNGEVEIGDTVFSVGNAQGEGIAYRAGQVASFTPEREYGKWKNIRFTSPASPGNSGGPLLNLQGEVVGLIIKKNQSENYNIAVPIAEADKLTNKAEFHLRNVTAGIYGVDDSVSRDWLFSVDLPATVEETAAKAQDGLNLHWNSLSAEVSEKVKERNYPAGKRFRDYLRNQRYVKGFAPLVPGKDFNKWKVADGYREKIAISQSQSVFRGNGLHTDLHVIVEKPAAMSLQEFLDSPRIVMDNLLKAISFTRQVGTEKVPVISLGEPGEKRIIEDKLGRKWISSLWDLPYSDMFVYSSCLPYPKGVVCNIDTKENGNRKYGYFENVHDGYNEIAIGYEGDIDDWQEYFDLGEKYLPELFSRSSITRKEKKLTVELNDFTVALESDKIQGDSSIHFHLGYANEELLAEDILLFELFPIKGAQAHYRIQTFYEPGDFGSDKYKSKWNDVMNGTGSYSGKVINKGDKLVIREAVAETKKVFTSVDGEEISKVSIVGCSYKASEADVEQDCEDFSRSITFR